MEARWAGPKSLRGDLNVTEKSAPIKGGFNGSAKSGPTGGYGSGAWGDHAVYGSRTRRDGQPVAIAEVGSHARNSQIADATPPGVIGGGIGRHGAARQQH